MTSTPAGLEVLGKALGDASRKGYLPDPGRTLRPDQTGNDADSRAYVRALRSKLRSLGYLADSERGPASGAADAALGEAVARFQKEAGLVVDTWAGPLTWRALRQLTGFEDEQDPTQWTAPLTDLSRPAVARAVYLRLFALGAIAPQDRLGPDTDLSLAPGTALAAGLDRFLGWAQALGRTSTRLAPVLDAETLTVIYGQDALVGRLAAQDEAFFRSHEDFVRAAACIELWLLGFDVEIANRDRKKMRGRRMQPKLRLAVRDFWGQQDKRQRPDGWRDGRATPRLFARLAELEMEEAADDDRLEQDLVQMVAGFTPRERRRLVDRLKDLASSIWDGTRRLARYLRNLPGKLLELLRKGKEKALHLLKNAARFLVARARQAFGTMLRAVEIVYRGVVYLRGRVLPGSDPLQIVIRHDGDFDMRTFVHADANREKVRALVEANGHAAVVFGAACSILGALAVIAGQVARALAGPVGWLLALLSLTRLARHLRTIHEQVRLVRAFEMDTRSPFANRAGRDDDEA